MKLKNLGKHPYWVLQKWVVFCFLALLCFAFARRVNMSNLSCTAQRKERPEANNIFKIYIVIEVVISAHPLQCLNQALLPGKRADKETDF